MTGFGRGHSTLGAGRVIVELRTVNHKYQDVRLHVPPELGELEAEVERRVRRHFRRGRIDVTVRLRGHTGAAVKLQRDAARSILEDLESLRVELGLEEPLSINVLAAFPQVFVQDDALDEQGALQAVTDALGQAIGSADEMRGREAEALGRDFERRLAVIQDIVGDLGRATQDDAPRALERIRIRLEKLLGNETVVVDEGRLLQEMALLADRADVAEELTRLASHVDQFRKITGESEAIGRRLDFLLQEMSREASTVGAKVQDADMQHLVVDLRGEITRMREQVQNIE